MGNNELSVVENVVANEAIEKFGNFDAEIIRLLAELFHRLRKPVCALHVLAS